MREKFNEMRKWVNGINTDYPLLRIRKILKLSIDSFAFQINATRSTYMRLEKMNKLEFYHIGYLLNAITLLYNMGYEI